MRSKTRLWNSWVKNSLEHDTIYQRRFQVARALERYYEPQNMPKIRLVDGGVTDNLGVRGSMMSPVAHYGNVREMSGAFTPEALSMVRRVLVIVANAQSHVDYDWSRSGAEPGVVKTVSASFNAAIGILNSESITLAKRGFDQWRQYTNSKRAAGVPKVNVYFSTITFDHISDDDQREYFNAIPTTFSLSGQHIDSVRKLAGELLDRSPEFQAFRKNHDQ